MRPWRLLAAALAVALGLVIPALAKEGVRAKLEAPVRLDTAAGKTITVRWRLVDDQGRPFGASGIYLRVSTCRGRLLQVAAKDRGRGRYRSRVTVPRGGIRKLRVGLPGIRIIGERQERADAFFDFDPPLRRSCS